MVDEFNKDSKKGEYSEWNEGDYKNLRLHKAQEMINLSSVAPMEKINFFDIKKYGYELWFDGINILFGEGMQKYGEDEYKKVVGLRNAIEEFIRTKRVCYPITNQYKQKGMGVNMENLKDLKMLLRDYEYLVKVYNDKHGLSTRNRDDDSDGL